MGVGCGAAQPWRGGARREGGAVEGRRGGGLRKHYFNIAASQTWRANNAVQLANVGYIMQQADNIHFTKRVSFPRQRSLAS